MERASDSGAPASPAGYAPAQAWAIVGILSLAFILSFVDRQILALLVMPVRAEFGIGDVAFSVLVGFAFACTYSLAGVPLGYWVDRGNRKMIVALGIVVWSLATAACGLVESYAGLFAARVMVGLGEAALVPAAFSIIADIFPKDKLGKPMAVFMSASTVGAGLALMLGGYALSGAARITEWGIPFVQALSPWRITFLVLGLPGLLLAAVVLFAMRNPERRNSGCPAPRASSSELWKSRAVLAPMFLGFTSLAFTVHAVAAWAVEVFRRTHGWAPTEFAALAGPMQIAASILGTLAGGFLIDRQHRRGRYDGSVRLSIIVLAALTPTLAATLIAPNAWAALGGLGLSWFMLGMLLSAPGVALQISVSPACLGLGTSVLMLVSNLIGMGAGPTSVAVVAQYVFGNENALGAAAAVTVAVALTAGALLLRRTQRQMLRTMHSSAL